MSGLNLLQRLRQPQSQAGRQLQRELRRRGTQGEEWVNRYNMIGAGEEGDESII